MRRVISKKKIEMKIKAAIHRAGGRVLQAEGASGAEALR